MIAARRNDLNMASDWLIAQAHGETNPRRRGVVPVVPSPNDKNDGDGDDGHRCEQCKESKSVGRPSRDHERIMPALA